ncbi:MAG: hypothetical protein GX823_01350 [Clostridiales bacterium]|nr:hypothetical protein [Clostridiales bacterium]
MTEREAATAIAGQTGIRSYYEYQQTRVAKTELGKDDFLALLAAQLQYQNPLEPQKDTDFIAQLAQFSSLQYMQTMSEAMMRSQYFDLAGKYIFAEVKLETGETIEVSGVVDMVVMKDGTTYAQVGEYMIDCSKINHIIDRDLFTGNNSLLSNSSLIGKYLQAYVPVKGADGEIISEIVSGLCTRVSIEDGVLVAYLEKDDSTSVKVGLADIFDVSGGAGLGGSLKNPDDADLNDLEGAAPVDTDPDNGDPADVTNDAI